LFFVFFVGILEVFLEFPFWEGRLQNKIISTGNALQRLWPEVPPGKAPEQDNYQQEMPSRGSGQDPPGKAPEQDNYQQEMPSRGSGQRSPRKGSRTRKLSTGNALQKFWPSLGLADFVVFLGIHEVFGIPFHGPPLPLFYFF